jgi:hypothetical protein
VANAPVVIVKKCPVCGLAASLQYSSSNKEAYILFEYTITGFNKLLAYSKTSENLG